MSVAHRCPGCGFEVLRVQHPGSATSDGEQTWAERHTQAEEMAHHLAGTCRPLSEHMVTSIMFTSSRPTWCRCVCGKEFEWCDFIWHIVANPDLELHFAEARLTQ